MAQMQARLKRSEVPEEFTWDLSHIFATPADWEAALAGLEAELPKTLAYKGRLGEGPQALLGCLSAHEALMGQVNRVRSYASLTSSGDATSPTAQAMMGKLSGVISRLDAALSFLNSEIAALPDGTVERYLAEEPALAPFAHSLEKILIAKPYQLSAETEQVLAALGEALQSPSLVSSRAMVADLQFPPVVDTEGQAIQMSMSRFAGFLSNTDREMRRKAAEALVAGLNHHKNTLATTLATMIKRNVTMAKLRGYGSAEEMLLHSQQVPLQVYHNVLDILGRELAPHFRRLMNLRKRILGVDQLYRYDLQAPLDPDYNPKITWDEAATIIQEGLAVLGPEYGEGLRRAFAERWIDRADNIGKSTGAFCSPVPGVHPYVLTTWNDSMRGCFVLGHELGHAGHMLLTDRYQPVSNAGFTRFFVESPSTCNELILADHLLGKTTDKQMRRWILLQSLGTFYHNFVNHLLEGHLERRLYAVAEAGRPITLAVIMEEQARVFDEFWQGVVETDEQAKLNWMMVPHYYVGLYPFTYAAGLSASVAVAEAIRTEGQPAVDRWLKTLKAGDSKFPMELMAMAGIDMNSPEVFHKAAAYVGRMVDEVEALFA